MEKNTPKQLFHSNVPINSDSQVYLKRTRIDRLLEQAMQNQVVIVSAGAGYGKTHAVYSFVNNYPALTCWIQLSEWDNISERFWENFIDGVSGGNKKAAVRLENMEFPETDREFDRYLTIPRQETRTDVKYVFVYDDFHLIHNKKVLRFLERSITMPFPNITSILISRTELPLNLMGLESKGLLARITEEDLRFTIDEMAAYFQLLGVSPSPQTVSSIYYDTEGWAFAIHLAGLSLRNAPSGAAYVNQALRSNIFKLIASEIMDPLPVPVQRFLIKLSLIDHLVPELLEEIADDPSLIEGMKGLDSFIRFDVYHNAYHIHHLFLDYLKGRQNELTEYDKKDLWHKTAAWCAENNLKLDAITYYEKAGDYERLIDVVTTMPVMLPNRTARMLLDIMERAPPEIYNQIPHAQVQRTGLYLILEMFDKSREELITVIGKLEAAPPSPAVYRTLTGCYNLLGFIGLNTSSYTRDYDYVHYFKKALHYYELNKFEVRPPMSLIALGSYLCRPNSEEAGEMEKYIEAISAMIPYTSVTFGGCAMGLDDLCRGELAFFKGDMPGAEQFVLRALQSARQGNQYEVETRALFYLVRIKAAQGNYPAIEELLKQMEALLEEQRYPTRFTNYDILTGWYYAHTGQTDKLAPWLQNDFEESDLNSIVFGLEILVKAKYHFAEKRCPAALAVLASRETRGGRWDFVLGKIEMKALEAVSRYQLRDREGAFAALTEAYRLAKSNLLYMPFTELGKDMRTLADAALKDRNLDIPQDWLKKVRLNAAAYARKLFAVTEQSRPAAAREGFNRKGVKLSRREMEVLTNLAQGMTQEEIAGISSLSVNTVKSVIRSIYNKLGAINKADAVRIAASLAILGTGGEKSPEPADAPGGRRTPQAAGGPPICLR
ncbi:MAG: LuxR C-terminal-related transcriptional regulator [Spirochaetaceae bacterium]|jgi:LuxR family maltose regulon positive regulatory protein|nr:LuxR C-terminal-related transcriptional regulator [Spirochaetaceae bacterium]